MSSSGIVAKRHVLWFLPVVSTMVLLDDSASEKQFCRLVFSEREDPFLHVLDKCVDAAKCVKDNLTRGNRSQLPELRRRRHQAIGHIPLT